MDTMTAVVIALVVLLVAAIGVAAWLFRQNRRTQQLREDFGPEYGRAVRTYGDRGRAEAELQSRKERVEQLHLRRLSPEDQGRFAEAWRSVQARFVENPAAATRDADRLVAETMQARGYPVGDFERRAADISVDHPKVVENYRAAHAIALRNERGEASTEDLRQAMIHYRALFEELLEAGPTQRREVA
jgi:hypothetical protein